MGRVFYVDVDRVYCAVTQDFFTQLETLASDPKRPFYAEGEPHSDTHDKLKGKIAAFEPNADHFRLRSFRQEGQPSLQASVALPPANTTHQRHYADLDIDLGNPLQDVQGFFIHMGELIDPGKTDHLALWKKLKKGKAADFLYYKVVTATTSG